MTKTEFSGVRAKLAAYKEENKGERTVTLNGSGVVATIPNFISHAVWMHAVRQAAGDGSQAQAAFICEAVRFDGEKLTLTDFRDLLSTDDGRQVVSEVFNRKPAEGTGTGNDQQR